MSDLKRQCPACNTYGSDVGRAFAEGNRCPSCGLSAAAANEIEEVKAQRADDDLKRRLAEALGALDLMRSERDKLRDRINEAQEALGGNQ